MAGPKCLSSGLTPTITSKGSERVIPSLVWTMISGIVHLLLCPRKQSSEGRVILFGFHSIYHCPYCVKCVSRSVVSDSLQPNGLQPRQAPLCMEFSRQEYWSGLPFSSPGDIPDPGIKPVPLALQADSLRPEPPGKPLHFTWCQFKIQFK